MSDATTGERLAALEARVVVAEGEIKMLRDKIHPVANVVVPLKSEMTSMATKSEDHDKRLGALELSRAYLIGWVGGALALGSVVGAAIMWGIEKSNILGP